MHFGKDISDLLMGRLDLCKVELLIGELMGCLEKLMDCRSDVGQRSASLAPTNERSIEVDAHYRLVSRLTLLVHIDNVLLCVDPRLPVLSALAYHETTTCAF